MYRVVSGVLMSGVVVGTIHKKYLPVSIIWDLDHTLLHSRNERLPPQHVKIYEDQNFSCDLYQEMCVNEPDFLYSRGNDEFYYVYVRFGVRAVITAFSWITDQYVFTNATRDYADTMMHEMGIEKYIKGSISRNEVPIDREGIIKDYIQAYRKVAQDYHNGKPVDISPCLKQFFDSGKDTNDELVRERATQRYDEMNDLKRRSSTVFINGKDTSLLTDGRRVLIDDQKYAIQNQPAILIPAFNDGVPDVEIFRVAYRVLRLMFTT